MENNEKENVVIDDFEFSLIADFFRRVDRDLVAIGRHDSLPV